MKHLGAQHAAISKTIDVILTRGGEKLYQSYIKEKLPNHASQETNNIIHDTFNAPYQPVRNGGPVPEDRMPKGELKETIMPKRIRKEKNNFAGGDAFTNNSAVIDNLSFVKSTADKYQSRNPTGVMTQRVGIKKYTPKLRQKISINCKSLANPQQQKANELDGPLRLQKKQNQRKQFLVLQQQHKKQSQKSSKRRKLQNHIQQLQILGIPYAYDDDGSIHSPDVASFKYAKARNQYLLRKREKIVGLKHQTIDVGSFQRYVEDVRAVVGRKKGYFSSQFYKKLRMTNQEYNNQNGRQNSNIPFLSLTQGVRIVERQRNITAQKLKKPIPTLSQFKQKTQSNMFKSYLPEFDAETLQTMSIDRPLTTGQFNRTKRTAQTSITKANNSILWRPRTTSKGGRLKVNNQELAKHVMGMEER